MGIECAERVKTAIVPPISSFTCSSFRPSCVIDWAFALAADGISWRGTDGTSIRYGCVGRRSANKGSNDVSWCVRSLLGGRDEQGVC